MVDVVGRFFLLFLKSEGIFLDFETKRLDVKIHNSNLFNLFYVFGITGR